MRIGLGVDLVSGRRAAATPSAVRLALEPLHDRYRILRSGMLIDTPLSQIATFARSSRAWDFDAAGNLATYEADMLRNGYSGGQRAGWLLEGQATNAYAWSAPEPGKGWSIGSSTIYVDTADFPGLPGKARRYSCGDAASNVYIARQDDRVAGTTYTASIWVRRLSGSGGTGQLIKLQYNNGTADVYVSLPVSLVPPDGVWRRYKLTVTDMAAGRRSTFYMADIGVASEYEVWNAQIEPNYFASSDIICEGSAVTRAADNLRITDAAFANIFDASPTQWWAIIDVLPTAPPPTGYKHIIGVSDGTLNNRHNININSLGQVVAVTVTGNSLVAGTASAGTVTFGAPTRVGIRVNGSTLSAVRDAGPVVSAAIASAPPGLNKLWIGNPGSGGATLNDRILGLWAGTNNPSDSTFQAACAPGANVESILGAAA